MKPNTSFRSALATILGTLFLGTLIGALASLAAIAFIELIYIFNDWLRISAQSRFLTDDPELLKAATVLAPTLGGLIVGLIIWNLTSDRQAQSIIVYIADSLDNSDNRTFSLKDRFVNIMASLISLGCGASVGQYGAVAYLGGTIGTSLPKLGRKVFYHSNIAICCGVAAAISTIFNAPIAGIVFAHEVVLRHYSIRAFAPVTVASTVGYVITNQFFENLPLFSMGIISNARASEFVIFALIGISGAIIAQIFMQSILYFSNLSKKTKIHPVFNPMFAGLSVGLVALWLPDVMGVGKEAIRLATIEGAFSSFELTTLLCMKILLTGLCLGFGFVGGVLSPAIFSGIMFGTLWGLAVLNIPGFERSEIVFYTICGMVAVVSPVIGAPLTTILLVLELTRNYSLTTAAMVSVVLSSIVSYHLFGRSLFDKFLYLRGIDLASGRDKAILNMKLVRDYVHDDFCRVNTRSTLDKTRKKMISQDVTEAYLLDSHDCYLGRISLIELDALIDSGVDIQKPAFEHIDTDALVLNQESTVWEAMNAMGDFVGESIPVLDTASSSRMLGIVHESTIINAYLETTANLRREENL